jgi:hypothetical protein
MRNKQRERFLLFGAALLAGAIVLLVAQQQLGTARSGYESARNSYQTTWRNAERYVAQSDTEGAVLPKPPDTAAITAQLQQVLQRAGLGSEVIGSTLPSPPREVAGTNFTRQRYRVGLTGVSMNDVAQFIQIWSVESQVWTISEIQMRRQREAFEATLQLECLYIDEETQSARPGG